MGRDWNLELAKSRIREVADWLEKDEFSIKDLYTTYTYLHQIEQGLKILQSGMRDVDNAVKKAEWELFITTLPIVEIPSSSTTPTSATTSSSSLGFLCTGDESTGDEGTGDNNESVAKNESVEKNGGVVEKLEVNGLMWTWDCKEEIYGIPYYVYWHDDDFLYLFRSTEQGGQGNQDEKGEAHYFLQSEFAEPELVDRKMMGFGDYTQYRRTEDGIEITGSGTVNVAQMFRDHGGFVDMDNYWNPIIERGDKAP